MDMEEERSKFIQRVIDNAAQQGKRDGRPEPVIENRRQYDPAADLIGNYTHAYGDLTLQDVIDYLPGGIDLSKVRLTGFSGFAWDSQPTDEDRSAHRRREEKLAERREMYERDWYEKLRAKFEDHPAETKRS